ncbi:MAG: dihydropteroate synthase [Rhodobacteraceae bacterium]|nr:dihydropteroate synthase [Paracoccaceae bacterium]
MGILNLTPDSFSDGGRYASAEAAIAEARRMHTEGAAIVDVGAESTRPGATPITAEEELARLGPVLDPVCETLPVAVSIDTYKAVVARQAVGLGAAVINDVWGLQRDPEMAYAVAETESAVIIMHNRDAADESVDILDDISRFFERSLRLARAAGVPDRHVLLDPGIGFGKTIAQNYTILAHLRRLSVFGRPILLGLSRKRMIGHVLDTDIDGRLIGTVAANVLGLAAGARVLRVHDVAEHHDAIRIFKANEAAK